MVAETAWWRLVEVCSLPQHQQHSRCLAMVWRPDLLHSPVPCVLSISKGSHNPCYGGGNQPLADIRRGLDDVFAQADCSCMYCCATAGLLAIQTGRSW